MANLTDFPIEGTSALFSSGGDGDLNYTGELVDSGVNLTDGDGNVLAGTGKFIGDLSGSAVVLETARTIGGVSFNGSANINLPGVNEPGNQDTTGNAATATTIAGLITAMRTGYVKTSSTGVISVDTALPLATTSVIGGFRLHTGTLAANNYKVELGATGTGTFGGGGAYVQVPWTNTTTTADVLSAGAVMQTGSQNVGGEKTFTSPTNTPQLNLTEDGGIGTNVDDDVRIYRDNVDKITFGDDETIIEDNTLFNSYVSVGGGTHASRYAAPLTIRAAEYGTLTGGTMRYRWITSSNASGMDGVLKSYGTLDNTDIEISIWAIHSIVTRDKLMAHGSMLTASDDRIKSEETPIENATEALLKLTPKNYFKHASYRVDADDESPIPEKDSSGNSIYKSWESGLISQDVLKVDELQHIVEHMPDTEGEGDTISLKYTELIPWLIKSIQELNQRIIELEQK